MMKKLLFGLFICGFALQSAHAAFDVYMRFIPSHDYEGESQNADFNGSEGWFELISVDFGIENNINIGSITMGGGAGKAVAKELTVVKRVDAASPMLFRYCALGNHFDDAEIIFVRSGLINQGKKPEPFLKLEFKLVMVQDIAIGASDGDDIAEESVIFQYGAQRVSYRQQKQDGSYEPAVTAEWSFVKNQETFSVQ